MKMASRHAPEVVEEVNWGLYIWQMPNGQWVGDSENNFLNVSAKKGDIRMIKILTEAVREYGIEDGAPKFLPGHRRINDDEFEIQRQRLMFGLVPDEQDVGVFLEE